WIVFDVNSMELTCGKAKRSELRCAPRTRALKQTFIRICRSGRAGGERVAAGAVPVHVLDVSCRGIGLLHREKPEPGVQFVIELLRRGEVVRRLLYSGVRCRTWGYRSFLLGASSLCLPT